MPAKELSADLHCRDGRRFCVGIGHKLSEPVVLEARQSISNTVIGPLNVLEDNGEVMCCRYEEEGAY